MRVICARVGNLLVHHIHQQYTKSILVRAANPRQAAHYYFLLCLYADGYTGSSTTTGALSSSTSEAMKKLCHESIVDVLLETGQIDDFLGGLSVGGEDGARRYGFLDRYLPLIGITNQDEFKRCIIRPAAERAERRWVAASQRAEFIAGDAAGSSAAEDQLQENNAVLLYNLAEDYDTVLDILSRRMSDGLAQHGLQAAADQLLSAVKRATGRTRPGIYDHDIDHLSRLETMAASVLEYYSARPQILARVSADRKRTLMSLTALAGFFKSVLQLVQDVVRDGVDVIVDSNVAGGYMARVGSRANWTVALAIIEDLGLVPGGMGTAAGSGTGETTVDYARVATKAEQLRREFNDVVLRHLPDVVLGVETLLLIGWHEAANAGRGGAQSSRTGRDISLQSRQLLSFVSAVSRWYKIPAEVRRRLVTIDELMMH